MAQVKTIAITGKGGTGKTMLATLMLKLLAESGKNRVLAIDADSAMSLPYTLGLEVGTTVSQMRKSVVSRRSFEDPDKPVKEMMREILEHGDGFDLLCMGRPEEPGCYCAVNELLRLGIDMLADSYDVVVIDGEAGPEQLNRRVLTSIDALVVLSDMSARSLRTARSILSVVDESDAIKVSRAGLVLNRFREDEEAARVVRERFGMDVIGCLPDDREANEYDRAGKPLLELPASSDVVGAARDILEKLAPDLLRRGSDGEGRE